MTNPPPFPRAAALAAGFALLAMTALGPFGLFTTDAVRSAATPDAALGLATAARFTWAIAAFVAVAILDVIIAVGLMVVFRPGAAWLSRLAMWLRVAYAVALAGLVIYLLQARGAGDGARAIAQVSAFTHGWLLALGVFGLHLIVLGLAGLRLPRFPTAIAWLLMLAGVGYLADALGAALLPGYALSLAAYVFIGELVLMVWLIFRGFRPPPAALR